MKHVLLFAVAVSIAGCAKAKQPAQSAEKPVLTAASAEAPSSNVASDPPPTAPSNEEPSTVAESAKPAPPEPVDVEPPPPPTVVLLRAGRKPRTKLRFDFENEQTGQLELLTDMEMGLSVEGNPLPKTALPTMKSVLDLKVTEALGESYRFEWHVSRYEPEATAGVQPQVMAAMKAQLATLVGMKGSSRIDSRGFNLGSTFSIPPGTAPSVRKMMEGMRDALTKMATPLPEEAIGVGGRWKVSQQVTENGTTSNLDTIYTVKRIRKTKRGVVVTFETTIILSGVPGPMKTSDLPAGTTMSLDSSKGGGSGKTTINLSDLAPVRSNATLSSKASMTATANGQTQQIGNTIKLRVKMRGL